MSGKIVDDLIARDDLYCNQNSSKPFGIICRTGVISDDDS